MLGEYVVDYQARDWLHKSQVYDPVFSLKENLTLTVGLSVKSVPNPFNVCKPLASRVSGHPKDGQIFFRNLRKIYQDFLNGMGEQASRMATFNFWLKGKVCEDVVSLLFPMCTKKTRVICKHNNE